MKKKMKLIIFFILIVLVIILAQYKVFFYRVRDNFLANVTEIKRMGNLYIELKVTGNGNNTYREIIIKDGNGYSKTIDYNSNSSLIAYTDFEKSTWLNEYDGKKEYDTQKNFASTDYSGYDLMSYSEEDFCENIKSIKKGSYKNKLCYVIEIEDKKGLGGECVYYIDSESYLPVASIYKNDNLKLEYEKIVVGTVKEIPEMDLTGYKKMDYMDYSEFE